MVTVVTLTVLACLAMAPVVSGQDAPPAPRRGGPMSRPDPIAAIKAQFAKLDLTDAQKTQLEALATKAVADMKAAADANTDKFAQLRKDMQAARDASDDAKVTELRQEMAKLMAPGREIVTKAEAAAKALLTPEQLKKLEQMRFDASIARGRDLGSLALVNAAKITLTDDQKTKITALVKASQEARAKITFGAADSRKQMQDLSDKLDTDVKAVLTDEQKTALDKIKADNPRRGRGGPNGGGGGARGNRGGGAPAAGAGATPPLAPAPAGGAAGGASGDRI
jgi:Spy/CpxP family protein refolding chaperone